MAAQQTNGEVPAVIVEIPTAERIQEMAAQQTNGEVPAVIVETLAAERTRRRQVHRVPPQLRKKQNMYDPVMVSLGPYHHGKPHLRQMEEYKRETIALFLSGSGRDKGFFYSKILERIDDVRSCYVGVMTEEFDDATLCEMILHDACFVICCMRMRIWDKKIDSNTLLYHIGCLNGVLKESDIDKLENQIPYWVIKLLIYSSGEDDGKDLLCKYLSLTCFGPLKGINKIPWEEEEPLHLLEANQRIFAGMDQSALKFNWKKKANNDSHQFYCVTYLKSKGIRFEPSSNCLKDVSFKSQAFYGQLMLPIRFVNATDNVLFSNMIVFEMSPGIVSDFAVTSYVNFMKMLIQSPQDAKELREKGILFSNLASDEKVVDLFREIDTMGVYLDFFDNVKMSVREHCKHKSKTWIAKLININFCSPWMVVALVVAFILVSTFLLIHAA